MSEEIFNLVTFNSTHHAIKAEKELISKGLKIRIIPAPTEVTASCGLSIRVDEGDFEKVKEILSSKNVISAGYYLVKRNGYKKEVVRL
ncbi:MAG: DUF3343 domain-containing protein [Clostridiaceae bacterium]